MKHLVLALTLFALPAAAFTPALDSQLAARVVPITEPVPLPEGTLATADGTRIDPARFAGEVSVMTLWATWCHECKSEMPRLNALAEARAGTAIKVRPLSIDRQEMPTARIAAHMRRDGLDALPLLRDDRFQIWNGVGARGTPTTIIVDKFGQVTAAVVGGRFNWTDGDVLAYLDALAAAETAEESRMLLSPIAAIRG